MEVPEFLSNQSPAPSDHNCADSKGHRSSLRKFDNIKTYSKADAQVLYNSLLERNKKWVVSSTENDPEFFSRLSKGQEPDFLLIGCADSRVPPDQLLQTAPGQLFIHRNVANLVVNTDMNFMSVLQYAVEVLRVKHVIVMGHYGCGGVKASMTNKPHGLIDKWLRNIKDVIRLHRHQLKAIKNDDLRFRRLVELNVEEQVFNIYKTSIIQAAWAAGDQVQVHGWVYDIHTGYVLDLNIEASRVWEEIEHLYEFDFSGHTGDVTTNSDDKQKEKDSMFSSNLPTKTEMELTMSGTNHGFHLRDKSLSTPLVSALSNRRTSVRSDFTVKSEYKDSFQQEKDDNISTFSITPSPSELTQTNINRSKSRNESVDLSAERNDFEEFTKESEMSEKDVLATVSALKHPLRRMRSSFLSPDRAPLNAHGMSFATIKMAIERDRMSSGIDRQSVDSIHHARGFSLDNPDIIEEEDIVEDLDFIVNHSKQV